MHKQAKSHVAKFIPEEVLVEILKRLPPKSLMRFTCVCKLWHSIIISASFIEAHLAFTLKAGTNRLYFVRKAIRVPRYSLCNDDASLGETSLLPHPLSNYRKKKWEILGIINGLVCLCYPSPDLYGTPYLDYMLWNPSVQKVRLLAKCMVADFGFYSRVSGFGYDSINDDYKVIRIEYSSDNPSAYLFSLRRGSWRELDYPKALRVAKSGGEVNFKGNVHWFSVDESGVIPVFDMVAEEFKRFMLPNGDLHGYLTLGVYDDSLSVMDHKCLQKGWADLWVMKEYGVQESWIKQFSVHIDVAKFAGFTYSGELLMIANNRRLISYNMETKDTTVCQHKGLSFCKVVPYVGSLILADTGSACPF